MKRKIFKQHAGSMLLMSVLILASVFTVAMAISSISLAQTRMGGEQARSTKAYFAAEAGAERVIYEVRKEGFIPHLFCSDNGIFGFTAADALNSSISKEDGRCEDDIDSHNSRQTFTATNASYYVRYNEGASNEVIIKFMGSYGGTNRLVELEY